MKIIAIHSFHRGTGKSNLAANVAVLLAREGQRVAIIDADVQSPAMHIVLGLNEEAITNTLNTFLRGQCEIEQAAYNVTSTPDQSSSRGQALLVPASSHPVEIARVLREGYAPQRLNDGIRQLAAKLALDAVIVDTHAGLNEEMLASLAASDVLALVMRLDHQDYQGTAIVIELARRLELPRILLIVNEVPPGFDLAEVKTRIGQAYECEVIAALPHSEDFMTNASAGPFVLRFPAHPMTTMLKQIAANLASDRDAHPQGRAS
jgi:septum site-determining protein MinD